MALARRRRERGLNYWPSYVDALSTLLLVIVFLLSIFVLGQFFLTQEIAGRDTVLERLNRQIAELTDLLALERSSRREVEDNLTALQSTLQGSEAEQARLQALLDAEHGAEDAAEEERPQHDEHGGAVTHRGRPGRVGDAGRGQRRDEQRDQAQPVGDHVACPVGQPVAQQHTEAGPDQHREHVDGSADAGDHAGSSTGWSG